MRKTAFYLCSLEKLRKTLDNDGDYPALLTDLPKAFDCIPHYLIINKLYGYGFDLPSLELINKYPSKSKNKQTVTVPGKSKRYEDGKCMRELSVKELVCNSYSLTKDGKYYVNSDIK